jgi:hypothetical protein
MLKANVPAEASVTAQPHARLPKMASRANVNMIDKCIRTYQILLGDRAYALCEIRSSCLVTHSIAADKRTATTNPVRSIFIYYLFYCKFNKNMSKNSIVRHAGLEPAPRHWKCHMLTINTNDAVVGKVGIEPTVSKLSASRFHQLSYMPVFSSFRFALAFATSLCHCSGFSASIFPYLPLKKAAGIIQANGLSLSSLSYNPSIMSILVPPQGIEPRSDR